MLFSALLLFSLANAVYGQENEDRRAALNRSLLQPVDENFQDVPLWDFFNKLTARLNINVVFHVSVQQQLRNATVNLELKNISYPQSIKLYLDQNGLDYLEMDERTIMIVNRAAASAKAKSLDEFVVRANEKGEAAQAKAKNQAGRFSATDVVYHSTTLSYMIIQLGQAGHIAVEFDDLYGKLAPHVQVEYFVVRGVTYPRALQLLLDSFDLKYEQTGVRAIKVGKQIAEPSPIPLEEIMTPVER
jgi:hypothetical protein